MCAHTHIHICLPVSWGASSITHILFFFFWSVSTACASATAFSQPQQHGGTSHTERAPDAEPGRERGRARTLRPSDHAYSKLRPGICCSRHLLLRSESSASIELFKDLPHDTYHTDLVMGARFRH